MKKRIDICAKIKSNKLLAFVRFVLNPERFEMPEMDENDWKHLYYFAAKQKIMGLIPEGIGLLHKQGIRLPENIVKKMMFEKVSIEKNNVLQNHTIAQLIEKLENDGFRCCILKGQGNSLLYPNVNSRVTGDIDVWMLNREGSQFDIKSVIRYVRQFNAHGKACYHHIDYGKFGKGYVEVHYRPSFMNNPIHNYRLQEWFKQQADIQFSNRVKLPGDAGTIATPTPEFNAVYQLTHIYNHMLYKGVILRHVMDYYYVTLALKDKQNMEPLLHYLGLKDIAKAMMWVLINILGMEEKYIIVEPDERLGRILAREILVSKNVMQKANGNLDKNLRRLRTDMRIVRYFPSESLCEPIFRLYHYFWRLQYNSIFKKK